MASELYAQDGTPCATCTCSFMSVKPGPGTELGFEAGAGLTLRVCRIGREPLVAETGTEELWCDDYSPFSKLIPLPPADLDELQVECSRGFLADLAQGVRPMPRSDGDLRWYDRGLREGWLPAHRIRLESREEDRIAGPWEQFVVVGVTPAFGDGHTPALGQVVLQARDRRTYCLLEQPDGGEAGGLAQSHGWWVNQVSSGAAIPLERPIRAQEAFRMLVLRGGERVLSAHTYRYLPADQLEAELNTLAEEARSTAEAALRRGNPVVAELCILRGLRARPEHPGLRGMLDSLG